MNSIKNSSKRSAFDLCLAFGIAFAWLLLSLAVNMGDRIRSTFAEHARSPYVSAVINLLFVWLFVMLVVAFRRWRGAARDKAELENVISSINPDALLVVTPERRIVMSSPGVRRLFGYSEREVLNATTDLLYSDRRTKKDHPREIYEALEKDGFRVGTATGKRKDGGVLPLEIIAGDLRGTKGAVLLLRDISERLSMETHKRRADARAQFASKLESLGMLAGGAAHDFNNLLMIVQGYAGLTEMSPEPPEIVRENMGEIQKAAKRAVDICERLLSFSGNSNTLPLPVNLSETIGETGRLFDASVPGGVRVVYELAPDLPLVNADMPQLDQVFINLLKNACEALGKGGGTITVSTGVIHCSEDELRDSRVPNDLTAGRYVFLRVVDTGCGMAPEVLSRVCEPFFTTKKRDGHGLGLASALGIIRSHGGTLKVESQAGEGSAFTMILPPWKA